MAEAARRSLMPRVGLRVGSNPAAAAAIDTFFALSASSIPDDDDGFMAAVAA